MLETRKLTKYFGGLAAISRLDFRVGASEIHGLIGPNGAGKTTCFNVISGFFPLSSGKILYEGTDISALKAHEVTSLGITRTFQASTLFLKLSVLENVFTGYHMSYRTGLLKRVLRTASARREEKQFRERAMKVLDLMGMYALKDETAANLPHGYQRILGIAMALATEPKLLLLDEPAAGMNTSETDLLIQLIRQIRDMGVTIILVEHDMKAVMDLCDRITVINHGQKIAEGVPEEIRENREVIEAYLGKEGVRSYAA